MEEAVDPHAFITKAKQNISDLHTIIEENKLTKETKSKMMKEINNIMEMISHMAIELAKLQEKCEIQEKHQTQKNSFSYSSAVKNLIPQTQEKRFPIIIKSLKEEDTEKIKEKIQKIKISQLGIRVCEIKKTKKNLIITCPEKEDAKKLKDKINEVDKTIIAEVLLKTDPCVIFKGLDKDYTEKEFLEDIIEQNNDIKMICEKYQDKKILQVKAIITNKKTNSKNLILQTNPEMRLHLINKKKVHLGFMRIYVEDCNPLTQCFHCQRFGHTAQKCYNKMNKPTCKHCSEDHPISECKSLELPPKCANCHSANKKKEINSFNSKMNEIDHRTNSETCKFRSYMLKLAKDRINYDIE